MHLELLKLGLEVSESTVSKYMIKHRGPPSRTWRTFLQSHSKELIALDFFTVPTASFKVLFVLIILSHDRWRVLQFNVIEHPMAARTARQLLEACGTDNAPVSSSVIEMRSMARYSVAKSEALSIQDVPTAPRSPRQNAYAERAIGFIRRECANHMIVLGEHHLRRIISSYVRYYNQTRTHLSLGKDAPEGRREQPPDQGKVIEIKRVVGLHHEYYRQAA